MPNRIFLVATLCIAISSLLGCGAKKDDRQKNFSQEERRVANVVDQLQKASEKQDGKKVCQQLLAKQILTAFSQQKEDCAKAIKIAFNDATAFTLHVKNVTIQGQTATAEVSASGNGTKTKQQRRVTFIREGTAWKIRKIL